MDFRKYWRSLDLHARARFAAACDTTVGYLNLISGGHKNCGETLALKIERESGHAVQVEQIRPDVPWEVIRDRPRAGHQQEAA